MRKFSETVPLIDRGTTRFKLARLAASLAARTYSVDGPKVVVRKCHVQYIAQFLERVYSSPIFGYEDFTKAEVSAKGIRDPRLIRRRILGTKFPGDLVHQLLYREDITCRI